MVGRQTHVLTRTSLKDVVHSTGSDEARALLDDADNVWARTKDLREAVELAANRERKNENTSAAAQLEAVAQELEKVESYMNNLTESAGGIVDLNV